MTILRKWNYIVATLYHISTSLLKVKEKFKIVLLVCSEHKLADFPNYSVAKLANKCQTGSGMIFPTLMTGFSINGR